MDYSVYKKYFEVEQAEALADLLKRHNIDCVVSQDRDSLDSLYGDNHFKTVYFVKIKPAFFEVADNLLLAESENEANQDDPDHYLHSFTDDELVEILAKPDEWNVLDYQRARKILESRGKKFDRREIVSLKSKRIQELAKPEEVLPVWIHIGYFVVVLGGVLGLFIGMHLYSSKKTLPDGRQMYTYKADDRKHGVRIIILGLIVFLVYTGIWISQLQ
jgi:hypothetical protein